MWFCLGKKKQTKPSARAVIKTTWRTLWPVLKSSPKFIWRQPVDDHSLSSEWTQTQIHTWRKGGLRDINSFDLITYWTRGEKEEKSTYLKWLPLNNLRWSTVVISWQRAAWSPLSFLDRVQNQLCNLVDCAPFLFSATTEKMLRACLCSTVITILLDSKNPRYYLS